MKKYEDEHGNIYHVYQFPNKTYTGYFWGVLKRNAITAAAGRALPSISAITESAAEEKLDELATEKCWDEVTE